MKEIDELNIPDDRRYSTDHEWACRRGGFVRIGISDYGQDQLGDIVYVELPSVGERFEADREFGVVESVKSVSELLMPVGGEVVAVNSALNDSPNLVNESPYEDGWMIEIRPSSPEEMDALMDAAAYLRMLRGE